MIRRMTLAVALSVALPAMAQDAAPISLTTALKAAHAHMPGALLEAELDRKDGARVYEIDLLHEGAIHQVVVDARSGAVLSTKERKLAGLWHRWFSYDEMKAAQAAPDSVLQSIAAAEQTSGGRATEVSLDKENGRWVYEIDIDGGRDMAFDARSGEMLSHGGPSGSAVTSGARAP